MQTLICALYILFQLLKNLGKPSLQMLSLIELKSKQINMLYSVEMVCCPGFPHCHIDIILRDILSPLIFLEISNKIYFVNKIKLCQCITLSSFCLPPCHLGEEGNCSAKQLRNDYQEHPRVVAMSYPFLFSVLLIEV